FRSRAALDPVVDVFRGSVRRERTLRPPGPSRRPVRDRRRYLLPRGRAVLHALGAEAALRDGSGLGGPAGAVPQARERRQGQGEAQMTSLQAQGEPVSHVPVLLDEVLEALAPG